MLTREQLIVIMGTTEQNPELENILMVANNNITIQDFIMGRVFGHERYTNDGDNMNFILSTLLGEIADAMGSLIGATASNPNSVANDVAAVFAHSLERSIAAPTSQVH
jgi:hypothetical protein